MTDHIYLPHKNMYEYTEYIYTQVLSCMSMAYAKF